MAGRFGKYGDLKRTMNERGESMAGRFGKYGDLKRKAALHRSRKAKAAVQKPHRPPKHSSSERGIK